MTRDETTNLLQDAVDILESEALSTLTHWDSVQVRIAIRHIKRVMEGDVEEQAVLAEREACARIAERYEPDEKQDYVTYASRDIRSRAKD